MEMKPETQVWSGGRRAAVWTNVVLQCALLLALLVVANLLARKAPQRFDLTSRRTYELSNIAEDFLGSMPYSVDVWVSGLDYEQSGDKSLAPAFQRTMELLEEFRRRTSKVRVHPITGDGGGEVELFRKHFPSITPATLYLLATFDARENKPPNKKILELYSFYQGNSMTGEIEAWRGEPVLVQTLRSLGAATKRIFYEVEGHQEALTADTRTMGSFERFLRLNEGVEFRRLNPVAYRTVPVDCDVLVVMGPQQPFQPQEIELFREYLKRGGSLLVALRARAKTGLEGLLQEYGVEVGDNVVLDYQQFSYPNMSDLFVNDFFAHEINRGMVNVQFPFPESCTVDPIQKRDPAWKIVPLVRTSPTSWEEKGEIGPRKPQKKDGDERAGPLSLVVAVEAPAAQPMDDKHKNTRLIVWGSAVPFSDKILRSGFATVGLFYVTNQFRWLTERELLTVESRKVYVKPLQISAESFRKLEWVVYAGFPAFGIALGILAWFVRRK